jgi:hypothetical protein
LFVFSATDTIPQAVIEMDRFSPVLLVSSSEGVLSRFNDDFGAHGVTVLSARDIETALSILEINNPVIALVSITVNTT